jgi:hypothetical protein
MKIRTSELKDAFLDWAVGKCEGATDEWHTDKPFFWDGVPCVRDAGHDVRYSPSTDWAQGGPIIEREKIDTFNQNNGYTGAIKMPTKNDPHPTPYFGTTTLIAAMRCYVSSKLGDEVEIPEE